MNDVVGLVTAHLPGYQVRSVSRLGEGTDHLAYEVNGELVVRCADEAEAAEAADYVVREARLLAAVAEISPVPVPEPVFVAPDRGCLAYRTLPGRPLLELPQGQHSALTVPVGTAAGDLLAALHATPVDRWSGLAQVADAPLADWRDEAADHYSMVAGYVPAGHRRRIDTFLATSPPPGGWSVVFSHNDLGIEHILMDPVGGAVTGIIDWSDAALVDPAYDFGLLYRDLGPAALEAALLRYPAPVPGLRERAIYYARCRVFEDFVYGLETGRAAYVDKRRAAMAWLFPDP